MKPIKFIQNQFDLYIKKWSEHILEPIYVLHSKFNNLHSEVIKLKDSLEKSQKLPAWITITGKSLIREDNLDRVVELVLVTNIVWLLPGESAQVWLQPDIGIAIGAKISVSSKPFLMSQTRYGNVAQVGSYPDAINECILTTSMNPAMKFTAVITYPIPDQKII